MKDKIVQLPGTVAKPAIGFIEAVKHMITELPSQLEYHKMLAKIQRTHYNALLEEGFTKDEAMHIITKMK